MGDAFKALADKKKEVYDEDLIVLIEKHIDDTPTPWSLLSLQTTAGTGVLPTATVAIRSKRPGPARNGASSR